MWLTHLTDLHLEFHRDDGAGLVKGLDFEGLDVVLLGGDIHLLRDDGLLRALRRICARCHDQGTKVVYILGNHEFYRFNAPKGMEEMERIRQTLDKEFPGTFIWLHNEVTEIKGVKIAGTPLWFREAPAHNLVHALRNMNDFIVIEDFQPWVYEENRKAIEFLDGLDYVEVVLTHHMPHPECTAPRFRGDILNPFFLCDVREQMFKIEPKLWLFGHTHDPVDFMCGDTRVRANPHGYPHEYKVWDPERIEIFPKGHEFEGLEGCDLQHD